MTQRATTDQRLYDVFIADLMKEKKTTARDNIEKKAVAKLYHDYGPSAFPKTLLVNDLYVAGFKDMSKRAANGEYDF